MIRSSSVAFVSSLVLAGCAPNARSAPPSAALPAAPGWTESKGTAPAVESTPSSNDPTLRDPAHTDPDKYKVVLENERVRVLRYRDRPGDKTQMHRHIDMVMYAIAPFKRRLTFADGTTREREFKGGEAIWVPAQSHIGENIGTTETDALLVETKAR